MRSSSAGQAARLLSLLGRHAAGEAAAGEAGAAPCLLQQLRNASSAKPRAPLPGRAAAEPQAAAAPTPAGRPYSAGRGSGANAQQKADRPWHRQERDVAGGAPQGGGTQPSRGGAGSLQPNGALREKPRFLQGGQHGQQGPAAGAAQRAVPPPSGFSKPRFLLERAEKQAAQQAGREGAEPGAQQRAPNGGRNGFHPHSGRNGFHPNGAARSGFQPNDAARGGFQPNSAARSGFQPNGTNNRQLNGERQQQRPQQAGDRLHGQQWQQGDRPYGQQRQQGGFGDRRQPSASQQQQQPQRPRPPTGTPQPMPWWQKERLAKAAAAEGAAEQQGRPGSALVQRQQQQQAVNGQRGGGPAPAAPQEAAPEEVHIPAEVSVLKLAALLGTSVEALEPVLRELDEAPSSEQDIVSPDTAELAALEFGKVALVARDSASLDADAVPRPAVVTVMGHVDHGKTTLLDALRSTSVAAHEAGGITQHIGAFEVQMPGSKTSLTFLDTPGHAAFSSMRARGAAVTDLVVLVVAADDGVMPQTLEAISHARAAGCPIVVAITKCDVPSADPARVRQQLIARGVELEEVGGSVQVVEVAATKGMGLDLLEDALLLQAELLELKASRSRRGEGVVIEAKMDKGQGPVATVVVKRGTLKVGQAVVVGSEWGKVRSLKGTAGKAVGEVLPGQPAEIAGLKGLPQAGDELLVVASEERALRMSRARTSKSEFHRRAAIARLVAASQAAAAAEAGAGGEVGSQPVRVLPIIVKADVQGSAEAVRDAVSNLTSDQLRVKVVHVGVGPISQSDVQLAVPLNAKILGFNVRASGGDVEALAKQHGLEIRCQRVIYHLLEEVSEMMSGAAPRVEHEVVVGAAEVLQVFQLKGARGKDASLVAGCRVTEGSIRGGLKYRVLRGGEVVHEGRCASLRRHKLEVDAVGKGTECGLALAGYDGFRLGDVLQCVDVEMRAAEIKSAV